jgi:hypothetical protein
MLVRLAFAWTDAFGLTHRAGELVDIDAVTLAELEEQGVVESMSEIKPDKWIGPGAPPVEDPDKWIGPGSPPVEEPVEEPDKWIGPGAAPTETPEAEPES